MSIPNYYPFRELKRRARDLSIDPEGGEENGYTGDEHRDKRRMVKPPKMTVNMSLSISSAVARARMFGMAFTTAMSTLDPYKFDEMWYARSIVKTRDAKTKILGNSTITHEPLIGVKMELRRWRNWFERRE